MRTKKLSSVGDIKTIRHFRMTQNYEKKKKNEKNDDNENHRKKKSEAKFITSVEMTYTESFCLFVCLFFFFFASGDKELVAHLYLEPAVNVVSERKKLSNHKQTLFMAFVTFTSL